MNLIQDARNMYFYDDYDIEEIAHELCAPVYVIRVIIMGANYRMKK